ncbi:MULTISPECIES: flagellar biosynthesis anti-sigma factor FlgM [Thauera]|uniref:Negative regulator of flagellin synthesis n=1 Tax=Thauera linaloolentis (strain DSM 12138 / JCM 21573 / CCUG 41526 / CIP 105981 / IAM 15112 / NBRC 102519 / 47Lol) TaxID=1123367 RepID=N6ZBE8_THAL4|nr:MULTISPECIES: flagellar biosynthesis anti-sigma factor FlgM [Thauera]ENO89519.1 putative negative regulator of flagellin synthesis FlgM [Thauera linaloolentis 47Lol = DSM 12138]MCM8565414.1 flagellar biosynthesis anti-sigma factor FlgM [Thauera linaloolentis]
MKIENTGKAYVPSQVQDARTPAQPGRAPVQASGDSVQLSPLATLMKKAESAISESSEVDQKRVDEIRQAISEGRFKIDANRIADGLIASVRDMLESRG